MRLLALLLLIGCERPLLVPAMAEDAGTPKPTACATFSGEQIALTMGPGGPDQDLSATWVDRGRWFGLTKANRLVEVTSTGNVVDVRDGVLPDTFDAHSAVLVGDRLVLNGRSGGANPATWVLRVDDLETLHGPILGPLVYVMAARPGTDEIYAVTDQTAVVGLKPMRLNLSDEDPQWMELDYRGEVYADSTPALAFDRHGVAYFASPNQIHGPVVLIKKGDAPLEERALAINIDSERISALATLPSGEVVAGTEQGYLAWLEDGEVKRVEPSSFEPIGGGLSCADDVERPRTIQAIAPIGDGFVFLNCASIGQWYPDRTDCPAEPMQGADPLDAQSPRRLHALGDAALIASGLNTPVWLRVTR